jgi:hypothetical protein
LTSLDLLKYPIQLTTTHLLNSIARSVLGIISSLVANVLQLHSAVQISSSTTDDAGVQMDFASWATLTNTLYFDSRFAALGLGAKLMAANPDKEQAAAMVCVNASLTHTHTHTLSLSVCVRVFITTIVLMCIYVLIGI